MNLVERLMMKDLLEFKENKFSQFGEDGIIGEILRRISVDAPQGLDRWCVEFGAWDGIRGSNTYNLIKNSEYRSVLIEPDKAKFEELLVNIPDPKHTRINAFVGLTKSNTLDALLGGTEIPRDFDFLSIDIDGMDYFIWQSFLEYRPKLVCIEFNPTIPIHISFIQPKDFGVSQGSSARAIMELATEKGYALVAATDCNLFFVDFNLQDCVLGSNHGLTLEQTIHSPYPDVYVFSCYDGSIHLSEKLILPWHDFELDESSLQFLPKRIQTYLPNYTRIQRLLFLLFRINQNGFKWGTRQVAGIVKRNVRAHIMQRRKK